MNRDLAAIDLGSNSFHLLIVRPDGASFTVVERLKEKVQLLQGCQQGQLQDVAIQRGLGCLRRFAQRLSPLAPDQIVAMGTFALRQAHNSQDFIQAAQVILGAPIDIISGQTEAQLIYRAVTHHTNMTVVPRIVIDIGGGSTEIAIGRGQQILAAISVEIGCVSFKDEFFTQDQKSSVPLSDAKDRALSVLRAKLAEDANFMRVFAKVGDELGICCGTSGSIESIHTVVGANGWSGDNLSLPAMQQLETALLEDRWVIEAGLPGLAPDRADIFPAGVAILSACFEVFNLCEMRHTDVSLLQGIVWTKMASLWSADPSTDAITGAIVHPKENFVDDQVAQLTAADIAPDARSLCEHSVERLTRKYVTDVGQAKRVIATAMVFYPQCEEWWEGKPQYKDLLRWAAKLHEVGVHINSHHYHRHGGYIVKHAQMPGFSDLQKSMLALLIRGHRRSMPGLAFRSFEGDVAGELLHLVVLLRLAVILQRSHTDEDSPNASLTLLGQKIHLDCGPGWLAGHPLSATEFVVETQQLATAGLELIVS